MTLGEVRGSLHPEVEAALVAFHVVMSLRFHGPIVMVVLQMTGVLPRLMEEPCRQVVDTNASRFCRLFETPDCSQPSTDK